MLFFVYGTLKKDFSNHHILKKFNIVEPISIVSTVEKYPLFELRDPFPYLQDSKGNGFNIIGELYDISEDYEAILDEFECVPSLYKKGFLDVVDSDGNIYNNVNVYFKAEPIDIDIDKVICINEYKQLSQEEQRLKLIKMFSR